MSSPTVLADWCSVRTRSPVRSNLCLTRPARVVADSTLLRDYAAFRLLGFDRRFFGSRAGDCRSLGRLPAALAPPLPCSHSPPHRRRYRGRRWLPIPPLKRHLRGVSDRKSTRLNSSHGYISYAVFCL